ncbi:replication enhancer protein [Fraxinus symptomless virus]|nr:replication enhancer protein [Fraxinus symptomless virus]
MDSNTGEPLTWQQLQVGEYTWVLNNPFWIRVQHSGQTTNPPFHHMFNVELRFNYNLRMKLGIKRAWWTIRIWTTLRPTSTTINEETLLKMISGNLSQRLYFYIHKKLDNLGVISLYNFLYCVQDVMCSWNKLIVDWRVENEYISFY